MNTQIYEEACDWFVNFRAGDLEPGARKSFDAWLRKSPEHLRAYLEITEIWQDAAEVQTDECRNIDALICRARAVDNVFALEPRSPASNAVPRSRWLPSLAALAASLLLAIAGLWAYMQRNTYSTGTGEQRSVVLADGSAVQLNARSRIKISYTDSTRRLELMKGQAIFRVAKDSSRPFVVSTDAAQIRAVGTQFDVYRKKVGTVVTVLEGRVVVSVPEPSNSPAAGLQRPLDAGEQLTVKPRAPLQTAKVDPASVSAWTQNRIVFKTSPLPEVVEEFNRYNSRPLILRGEGLEDFHISGVYASTDPALLLRFLSEQPGMRVHETDEEIVITKRP